MREQMKQLAFSSRLFSRRTGCWPLFGARGHKKTPLVRASLFANSQSDALRGASATCTATHRHRRASAKMGSHDDDEANMEIVALRTDSPCTRRARNLPNATSRTSSGRRGPKMVNFKSPPRAVFKSSAAARQACAPHAHMRHVQRTLTVATRASQAVVTCLPLSAASAHEVAMSAGEAGAPGRFQGYEPTGVTA